MLAFASLLDELGALLVPEAPPCFPSTNCLKYTSDVADDLIRVDLGGTRIIHTKNDTFAHTCIIDYTLVTHITTTTEYLNFTRS